MTHRDPDGLDIFSLVLELSINSPEDRDKILSRLCLCYGAGGIQLDLIPIVTDLLNYNQPAKMTMWADNIKFVKDIIDGKYQKIDSAAAEVPILKLDFTLQILTRSFFQMTENAESLLKDPKCQKSKEHFMSALRVLELVQIAEIEMLLDTIIGVSSQRQ